MPFVSRPPILEIHQGSASYIHADASACSQGDFVLIAVRDYQPDRADVFHKYSPEDVAQLKKEKRLRPPLVEDDDMEDDEDLGGAGGGMGLFKRPADEEEDETKVDIDAI
jgi:hypothetical protein